MTNKEREVYEEAGRLFDYSCALCGSPFIAMHHIRYGGNYGGRKTYEGNVIPLCPRCHEEAHRHKEKYMKILIAKYEEKKSEMF